MKKLLASVVLLLASVCAWGQGSTLPFPPATNQNGSALSFAKISFCTIPATLDTLGNCTNTISVFKDQALTPGNVYSTILTDGIGYFPPNFVTTTSLWFSPGTYCYTLTVSSMTSPATNPCTPFTVSFTANSGSLTVPGNITQTQPTAATAIANQSSFLDCMNASYWTGAVSATDQWCFQDVLGAGANPTSTYTFTHSGSSGVPSVSFSGLGLTAGSANSPNTFGPTTINSFSAAFALTVNGTNGISTSTLTSAGITNTGDELLSSGKVIKWNADTGLSRDSAGVIDVGNGTQGDISGGIKAASLALGGGTALTTTNRTGTGNLVLATSPTLVTPVLGVASATSIAVGGGSALTGETGNGTNISTFSMLQGSCLGTASAGTTLGLNFGPCTSGVGVNMVVGTSATIKNLFCAANTGGVNASSGAVSVSKNGSAQTLTCTFGTATACNDTTHSFSVVSGDKLVLAFTTQAAETLATVSCTIQVQ